MPKWGRARAFRTLQIVFRTMSHINHYNMGVHLVAIATLSARSFFCGQQKKTQAAQAGRSLQNAETICVVPDAEPQPEGNKVKDDETTTVARPSFTHTRTRV